MKFILPLLLLLFPLALHGAQKKFSDLPTLSQGSWASGDLIPIVDISAGLTKNTTVGDFDSRYFQIGNILGVAYGGTGQSIPAAGNFLYSNGSAYANVGAACSASQLLLSNGAGVWSCGAAAIAGGGTGATTKAAAFNALSPMTTSGDVIYGGSSGAGTRLAKGSDGQVLTLASGLPSWGTPNSGAFGVTGSYTSPTAVTTSGINYSSTPGHRQLMYIVSGGGAVNITNNPQISVPSDDGDELVIVGTSNSDTVLFEDGDGLSLTSSFLAKANSVLGLYWDDDNSLWKEYFRSQNSLHAPTTQIFNGANYYTFTVTSTTVGAGSVYTNNSSSFTVVYASSQSGATKVMAFRSSGTNAPASSGTLTYSSGSPNNGNITFASVVANGTYYPTSPSVLWTEVKAVGGGGQGAGNGSSGGNGNNTTFGSGSVITANGGTGATNGNNEGGAGGTATTSLGSVVYLVQGGAGGGSSNVTINVGTQGGQGGNSCLGGGGGGGGGGAGTGQDGAANTGGGGGGVFNSGAAGISGAGGGAGGCAQVIVSPVSSSYPFVTGTGGGSGTGGVGGSGSISIIEHYQ